MTVKQAAEKSGLSEDRIYQFLRYIGVYKKAGEKLCLTEDQYELLLARRN